MQVPSPNGTGLHEQAAQDLAYIRATMQRSGSFTAVPGWGTLTVGVLALATAWTAHASYPHLWLWIWLACAALSMVIGIGTMLHKARRLKTEVFAGPGRRFILSFASAIVAGAVLTLALGSTRLTPLLPAIWMMLYGVAVMNAGAFSVRPVPIMGACFLGLGAALLLAQAFLMPHTFERLTPLHDAAMAASFGLLHIVFGGIIARRCGG